MSAKRFYDADYLETIQKCSYTMIDKLGPITFRHLSENIARAHGFQRTGPQIKGQIWSAVSKTRVSMKTPDGETVFWPEGMKANDTFEYRGLEVNGEGREWRDVPYPEKLNLALTIIVEGRHQDEAAAMAAKIGLGCLRQTTRDELERLLLAAKEKSKT